MGAQPAWQAARSMSVEAWRELEHTSHDSKHEYIDGQVYAMAGGSLDHSQTSINVVLVLRGALGRGPCRVYNSDAAVRLSPTPYTYPDATVTCDERDRGGVTEIQAPRVVVEVLSPESTEGYDRGRKFEYYRACPTIQQYLLVATDRQAVEVYRRTAEGWGTFQAYGPGEAVELSSINVRFPLATLYELTQVSEVLDAGEGNEISTAARATRSADRRARTARCSRAVFPDPDDVKRVVNMVTPLHMVELR